MSGQFPTGLGGNPAGRVLSLLERVQERPGLTAAQLGLDLGVSERTVRRYVSTLHELGIPVAADRGRAGGYRLAPGFRMPPLMLSTDEAVALALLLAVVSAGRDDDAGMPVRTATSKLLRALPRAVAERVDDVLTAVRPPQRRDLLAAGAVPDPALLATLAGAVVAERCCLLRHRSGGSTTERTVNPYGMAVVRGMVYVHGWCHLRRGRRTFRLDRIERAELLSGRFTAPRDLDVAGAVERSLAMSWDGYDVSVLLAAGLDDVRAFLPGWLGVPETVDAHTTRLRLTTRNLDATVLRLSDHPFEMTVEGPPELREAFARRAAWMRRVGNRSIGDQ